MFKSDDSNEFKPVLSEIEDSPVSPLSQWTFWLVILIFTSTIIWMCLGEIDIVVSSTGRVMPVGESKIIQPLDSGIISKILVREGDLVKVGQPLVEIDPSATQPGIESLSADIEQSDLEIERINACIDGREFTPESRSKHAHILDTQSQLHASSLSNLSSLLAAKTAELSKTDAETKETEAEREKYSTLLKASLLKEYRLSAVLDIVARTDYDKVQDEITTYKGDIEQANHKLTQLAHKKTQLNEELNEIRHKYHEDNLKELADKHRQRAKIQADLKELSFKNTKQQIRSPINGHIDRLFVHTVGGVVTPAEKLMSIVPTNSPIIVKVTVLNKDIGFVKKDMPVQIKVETFDFQKYGMFEGKVNIISKDSYEDEKQGMVFDVYVQPTTPFLIIEGQKQKLETGMTLTAEIKVGKRRIIEFIIYPIMKYMHEGMSVR